MIKQLMLLMYVLIFVCLSFASCSIDPINGISNCDCQDPESGCEGSPIVFDLAGDGIRLTVPKDGVPFALVPGRVRTWSWTRPGSDDAWLVLDRNENGLIDDGSELFGDHTVQLPSMQRNGFAALKRLDTDDNGAIDAADAAWGRLRLWRDVDHDGVSQASELTTLDAPGIRRLHLAYVSTDIVDAENNAYRYSALIEADAPVGKTVFDVWLRSTDLQLTAYTYSIKCWSWGYFRNTYGTDVCNRPYVQGDPIVTDGAGSLARLVGRSAVRETKTAAIQASRAIVGAAANPTIPGSCTQGTICPEYCEARPFPSPDYYKPVQGREYSANYWYASWCEPPVMTGGSGGTPTPTTCN